MKFYEIKQIAGSRIADVYIFGDIVPEKWYDEEVSAKSFADEINRLDADEIIVHIDSRGGYVAEGWAMYNTLKQKSAKVTTVADGFVASAALYPFLAGEQRIAGSVSAFFLHNAIGGAEGYAEDLEKAAEDLRKFTEIGINAFTETTGQSVEKIRELMAAETWLSPEEAKELNIVTEIREKQKETEPSQSAMGAIINKILAKENNKKTVIEMMAGKKKG